MKDKAFKVILPITQHKGNARIKSRTDNSPGFAFQTRSRELNEDCYLEWQFQYDILAEYDNGQTTVPDIVFMGSNGKEKKLFRFSEILYWFYQWDIINVFDLLLLKHYIVNNNEFIDTKLATKYEYEKSISLADIAFDQNSVTYPVLSKKLDEGWFVEITIKEKQKAVGYQPMLYLCCPLYKLDESLMGRCAKQNESIEISFNWKHKNLILELTKLLGILSLNHKNDMIKIIDVILKTGKV